MVGSCATSKEDLKGSMNDFNRNPKLSITKQEFISFGCMDPNLTKLTRLRYALYLDFNFPDPSIEVQRDCIRFLLEPEESLKEHIIKTLKPGDKYYLINTEFWIAWRRCVGWEAKGIGTLDNSIELDVPIEKGHTVKLSNSLVYPNNFEVVPEKIYKAFRCWYKFSTNKPVSRKVIKCRRVKDFPYNPHELKMANNTSFIRELAHNYTFELELSLYFFLIFKVKDSGEFPENPQLGFLDKIIGGKQTNIHSIEIYISR
jgi:hypothetical protein